jgi:hypothetical protein
VSDAFVHDTATATTTVVSVGPIDPAFGLVTHVSLSDLAILAESDDLAAPAIPNPPDGVDRPVDVFVRTPI